MKKLPKDTKVAVYMRVGRPRITIEFTEDEVKVLRKALLNVPDGADLYERLGNELRKEKGNGDRSTEKS